MFHGVWQLAKRSLQVESVRVVPNLVRGVLALFLLLVIVESQRDFVTTARGLKIFKSQILLTHLFITINAVFGFSQVIIEEREAGTLDLLKLAGINRVAVIAGKGLPRLWESLLLIAVQFPFTLLTITIGGVSWSQVLAAYVYLVMYLVLVGGVGLFASASARTSKSAVVLASIIVFTYLLPFIFSVLGGWAGLLAVTNDYNLQIQTVLVMQSGFQDSPWNAATAFALLAGAVFVGVAWFNLNRVSLAQSGRFNLRSLFGFNARNARVWSSPIVWLDYTLTSGGKVRLILRSVVHVCLLAWMMMVMNDVSRGFAWAALLGVPVCLIDATWSASRLFSDEIRNQTWPILVQTPNSLRRILFHKTVGWLLGMLPAIVLPYAFIFLAIPFSPFLVDAMMGWELVIGALVTGLAVVAYLHLMVLFSLDWHWKAIPATLTITCVLAYVYVVMLVPWSSPVEFRCVVFVFTGAILIGISIFLQYGIYLRLKALAGAI